MPRRLLACRAFARLWLAALGWVPLGACTASAAEPALQEVGGAGPAAALWSASCAEHASCASCTADAAWLEPCRWCTLDQRCHERGSLQSPCSENATIGKASSCPAPSPPRTTFSLQDAYDMILHADAAYGNYSNYSDPIARAYLPSTFKVIATARYSLGSWEDAFMYLGVDSASQRIVAAFRGTTNPYQLLDELAHHSLVNDTWEHQPGALVNEYFVAAADHLINVTKLHTALEDLLQDCPKCEVWFTGHSLGGAVATITAFRVAQLCEHCAPTVYTFGQPRTGNAAFARLVDQRLPRLFRLVNSKDPVPHIPLCSHAGNGTCLPAQDNYYHAGIEFWFPRGDYRHGTMCGYRECTGSPSSEDWSCSDGVLSAMEPPAITDHDGYFNVVPLGYCGELPAPSAPSAAVASVEEGSGMAIMI